MPSRLIQFLIVLFWLVATAWYIKRDVAPYWRADIAPTIAIDLTDEALRQSLPVCWTLTRPGQKPCQVRTSVEYHDAEDEFSLNCVIRQMRIVGDMTIEEFRSAYRVTRLGRVLETRSTINTGPSLGSISMSIVARNMSDSAIVTCQVRSPLGAISMDAKEIPISESGSINPLHPIHKLQNVRPGQRWVQPMSDSLAEAQQVAMISIGQQLTGANLKSLIDKRKPIALIAEVTGPQPMEWHGSLHDCHVIEYRNDNYSARTWVRVIDGLVLRQEATVSGDEIILQRD